MCSEELEETLHCCCTKSPFHKSSLGRWSTATSLFEVGPQKLLWTWWEQLWPSLCLTFLNYVLTFFERRSLLEEQIHSPHGIMQSEGFFSFSCSPPPLFFLQRETLFSSVTKNHFGYKHINYIAYYNVVVSWRILFCCAILSFFLSRLWEIFMNYACKHKSNNWWISL